MNKSTERLIKGFNNFKKKYFSPTKESIYQELAAAGQAPKTILIGCSDSRVDPAMLLGFSPGEVFVVRNVANLVPPCEPSAVGYHGTSSALEFAVNSLKVENIIVLGHRQCGGIRALMQGVAESNTGFVGQWMSIAKEVRSIVLRDHEGEGEDALCRHAEMESIKVSIKNIMSFPFVDDACKKNQLLILGLYFDLELGELWLLKENNWTKVEC